MVPLSSAGQAGGGAAGSLRPGRHLSKNSTIGSRIGDSLALVPEDRQRDGLVPTTSVAKKITLASLGRLVRFFSLSGRAERNLVNGLTRGPLETTLAVKRFTEWVHQAVWLPDTSTRAKRLPVMAQRKQS